MSVSKIKGARRLSLLASSSLVAASLITGAAAVSSLAIAPGVALAADECGDPSLNGPGNDVFTCAGVYPAGVDYTGTTNGNLRLNLEDGVVITGGLLITGNPAEVLIVTNVTNVVNGGDPTITNGAGYAIDVNGDASGVTVDMRTNDAGDGGPTLSGLRGIRATNDGGATTVRMNGGDITTTAGFGIFTNADTTALVSLTGPTTVSSTGNSVYALSGGATTITTGAGVSLTSTLGTGIRVTAAGGADITSGGTITAAVDGIDAVSNGGPIVIASSGVINAGANGIITQTSGANTTDITATADINAGTGAGIQVTAVNGAVNIDTTGASVTSTGGTGIDVNVSNAAVVTINAADVSGVNGIDVTTGGAGSATVISTGTITATGGVGVNLDLNGGAAVAEVNNVNATGGYGVIASSATGGASVTVNGAVVGDGGVAAVSGGAGNATVLIQAGASVTGTDGFSYGAFAQTTGTGTATVTLGGDVVDGGVGAFAGAGNVQVTGAGNVSMLGAFDAVEIATTSGGVFVNLGGAITSATADGIDVFTTSGAITIFSTGGITAGDAAIEITSTTGDVSVNLSGVNTAGGTGVDVTTGGVAVVNLFGDLTADEGISVTTSGAGAALINLVAGSTVTATDPFGYGATLTTSGSGLGQIVVEGDVLDGGIGAFSVGTGDLLISGAGSISISTGFSAVDTFADTGTTDIILSGAVTALAGGDGINAVSNSGDINVTFSGVLNAGGDGILADTLTGAVSISNSGTITAAGTAINALTDGGSIQVTGSGDIAGGGAWGIQATSGATGGDILIVYSGDIGGPGLNTTGGGVLATIQGGVGDIGINYQGNVFTDGGGVFGVGVGGASFADDGNVIVTYGGVMESGTVGVAGAIFNPANTGDVQVTVLDGSSIVAGNVGVLANNSGAGGSATTIIGAGVFIDPDDYGVQTFSAAGDATSVTGAGTTILITNTDADNIAFGVYTESGAAADAGVGDEAVEIGIGASNTIVIDDGAAGDADGAAGVFGLATGALGGVQIVTGDDLAILITGNNAVGIGASTDGGLIDIQTGTGFIDILGLDGVDGAGVFPGGAGIGALSNTGDISITSNVSIFVNNGALPTAGISAQTGGAGTVTVTSNAQILSGVVGINAEAVDGDVLVVNNAFVGTALGSAINANSTGLGSVTVVSTASVGSTLGNGITATNSGAGGFVYVTSTGPTITAGFDGIVAINSNAANPDIVQVDNASAITANTTGGLGYGIFALQNGDGGILINQTGSIAGTSYNGIVATNAGAAGFITILDSGTGIGTAGDEVTDTGILASVTNGASTATINVQSTGNGGIFAGLNGISASNAGSGAVQVFTAASAPITVSGAGVGITTSANGGLNQIANNAAITSGGAGIVAGNVNGAISVGSAGAIVTTGGDGIETGNSGAGVSTIFTTASGTINASGNGIDANTTGNGLIDIDVGGAITAGSFGVVVGSTGGPVTVDTTASINAVSDGINVFTAGGQIDIVTGGFVTSTAGRGIVADAAGGNITVTSNALVTASGNGIATFTTGAGTTTIDTNASIIAGDHGISVTGVDGLVDIDTAASIQAGDVGILVSNSGTGAIDVVSGGVIVSGDDGISLASAGGAITVVSNASIGAGGDGIQASTSGAAISVTSNALIVSTLENGIRTINGGLGTTLVDVNANVTSNGPGSAAINSSTSGAGLITVDVANGLTINGSAGSAIRTTSNGGAVTINTGSGSLITGLGTGAGSWVVDLNNAAGGTTTFNVGASTLVRSADNTSGGYDDLVIRGIGGSVVINNGGRINGRVSFGGLTGNVVFNNTSFFSWHTTGASTFSAGADTLNNTGSIFTNAGGVATSWDFGAGADTFANSGLLVVGEPTLAASTLTITGLETWNNSGRIVFGSAGNTIAAVSDGAIDDRILASGTTFNGSGSSRLVMDANLAAVTQTSCAVLSAADCLSLTGGSTSGSTQILVNDISINPFGAFNPVGIVLVDVSGAGSTAATHFSLDPASDYWRADLSSPDGVLDKGLFFYDLTLNGSKQHVLVGLPDGEAFEFTTVGTAAQAAWYTTTGLWFERQADMRDQLDSISGNGAGVWVKIAGAAADRDITNSYDLFGVTYSFDTSYDQQTVALVGGVDFVGGGGGKAWVVGGQIGYVDSDVSFDASPTVASMEGMTIGLYGSYMSNGFFVDGIVNANYLDLDYQAITLAPAGSNIFTGEVNSLGFQVEGGWTMPLGANGFFEPVGSLSYVTTDIDSLTVPGATIEWDDQTSLRASLGGRLGLNADHGSFRTKWVVQARYWNEFEGENDLVIKSAGPDLGLGDDFSGSFGEVGGTINVFSNSDNFSAFLNVGYKFNDDYKSTDASLGLRWRW